MWKRRDDRSYEEALQERVEKGDDMRAARAALALGDLLVATHGGPPPLPAMLLWQCVATVGCRVCGSVCVGAELVAVEFDRVPQWAYGCRLLDALCRGDPAAAEACDLHAMPPVVIGALPHAVAHYADGSDRDDVRALVVHRAKQAALRGQNDTDDPPDVDDPRWDEWPQWPVGVKELVYCAHNFQQPLCVAAARGASVPLLQALEPTDGEDIAWIRSNAMDHAAASDAVGTLLTLVRGDPSLVQRAVVTCAAFGAVRCLEALASEFRAAAVAAAATALHGASATHVPMLCDLAAMPQVVPTLQFLKRCGAAALSAEHVAQLTWACCGVLHGKPRARHLWHGVACAPPLPWEQRLADYDVPGALAAALDVLGWEGDLAAAAEHVRGSADAGMRGLLAVLYDRGVRPTAAHVARACIDGDPVRVLYILGKAAPNGVDFRGAAMDASCCLQRLVYRACHRPSAAAAVAALIAAGAAPASPSASAALCSALDTNSPSVAEVLLDAGTPIDGLDGDGSPLHHAAGRPAAVAMLLRRGAAVDARARSGRTALAVALEWGHTVDDAGVDVSGSIALLLDHGASLDDVDGHGTCAEEVLLRAAWRYKRKNAVVADVLQRMHRARGVGVASLLIAASRARCAIAVRVVAGTLDAEQLAEVGAAALLAACGPTLHVYEHDVHAIMKALLEVVPASAVHATDDGGCTPLHLLLNEPTRVMDPSEAVGELLRRGADANAENADGHTALEVQLGDAEGGNVDQHGRPRGVALRCVEVLLQHGARCRSPLALHAIVSKCTERDDARVAAVVTQLIARGAPVDQRDVDGRTAEDHAQQRGLWATQRVLASAQSEPLKGSAAPAQVPCSASSGRSTREHSPRGEGASCDGGGTALRRRARPTGSSTSSSDGDEDETTVPAPRRHRREAGP